MDEENTKFAEIKPESNKYLFIACENGNKYVAKFLVEHSIDINKENKNGETPLFYACKNGNESLVRYFVERGADVNKENENGETPLFNACRSGNESLVVMGKHR